MNKHILERMTEQQIDEVKAYISGCGGWVADVELAKKGKLNFILDEWYIVKGSDNEDIEISEVHGELISSGSIVLYCYRSVNPNSYQNLEQRKVLSVCLFGREPLTAERYAMLFNEDVSKKDYDNIRKEVFYRARTIWEYICKLSERCDEGKIEIAPDKVLIKDGSTQVYVVDQQPLANGSCSNNHVYQGNFPYMDSFPAELLWNPDWKSVISKNAADALDEFIVKRKEKLARNKEKKIHHKKNQAAHKQLAIALRDRIRAGLTADEVKIFDQHFKI